ncbi:MAG: DNA/RNA nuclease SfsA [Clostridia bacterium]|nr:DNA/RNA nuclease SfsA [Clostridia bacterium]MBR5265436.1 DNA/RNA nuclease SfsA [Clostridia bacterium]
MKYNNIVKGRFISRPNRFIALCEIDGEIYKCHVKNTGRCRELLTEGATVFLDKSDNPDRKTPFDLVKVMKGNLLVNMDSNAPNKVFHEHIPKLFDNVTRIKPEFTYGSSRIDFLVETDTDKKLIEIKGVTLENNGIVRFPDAPTERGIKHINELIEAKKDGYERYIVFIVQMEGMREFRPNWDTHPAFGEALIKARYNGVHILALGCTVSETDLDITYEIPVVLER